MLAKVAKTVAKKAAPAVKAVRVQKVYKVASPLSQIIGTEVTRTDATKQIWKYIKDNNITKLKVGDTLTYTCNDALKKALKNDTFTFASLQKLISPNLTEKK